MFQHHSTVHLKHLHRVADCILLHEVLCLRTREQHILLAEQGRDVPARNVRERVLPVLELSEPLRGQAQLGLLI